MKTNPLNNYIREKLTKDIELWFYDVERSVVKTDRIQCSGNFLKKLSHKHQDAFKVWDIMVRNEEIPLLSELQISGDWTYGYDFITNNVSIYPTGGEDETDIANEVYSLGNDIYGNYYLLLKNGKVAIWNDVVVSELFDNLDIFIWIIIHLSAVKNEKLKAEEVIAQILALRQKGGEDLIDKCFN